MQLSEILSVECVRSPLAGTEKQAVIGELVDVLTNAGKVQDPEGLKQAVWTREQTRTTGIGHGLAIPHGKNAGMKSLAMAIGKPAEPLDFEAIDNQPVKLVVLLASPPDRTSDHIQALARVSRLMSSESFREKIYAAETPEEIFELVIEQDAGR
ncbi:MAG: PTS sugar transporter subunit IIA [Phycisphaerales bacterium]|nr:PTS sugar transporter subunit IIA [Planctomycetota bacterium]MCH8507943.1 PTS sugar transporter subunit IIA [Phycisphaerales bacterium]